MKYLNKFNTKSDYQASASTLEIPNVAYITATTEVIYNATVKTYIVFADPLVASKCATLYGDGVGCTEADLGAVTSLNANDWKGSGTSRTPYTSFDELRYFTGITSIPQSCFDYSPSLTSVTIPESVTEIGRWAFYESPLESITFMSATAPAIANQVFTNLPSTGNITVPAGSEANYYSLAISLGENWTVNDYVQFADPLVASKCATLYGDGTGCTMEDLAAVTALNALDWSGTSITSFDELGYFTGLTSITDNAFYECSGLTSVVIPDTVTEIRQNAFLGCSGLTEVSIPDSVTGISYAVFGNCSGLTSVTIGDSVRVIGGYGFYGCSSLSAITFMSDTPPTLGLDGVFGGQPTTGNITVPVGSESNYFSLAQTIGANWTVNNQAPPAPPASNYVLFESSALTAASDVCELTLDGVTISGNWYSTNDGVVFKYTNGYRFYRNCFFDIIATGGNITKIEFTQTGGATYAVTNINPVDSTVGTYTVADGVGTWVASSTVSTVSFTTPSGQARCSKIKIYIE